MRFFFQLSYDHLLTKSKNTHNFARTVDRSRTILKTQISSCAWIMNEITRIDQSSTTGRNNSASSMFLLVHTDCEFRCWIISATCTCLYVARDALLVLIHWHEFNLLIYSFNRCRNEDNCERLEWFRVTVVFVRYVLGSVTVGIIKWLFWTLLNVGIFLSITFSILIEFIL